MTRRNKPSLANASLRTRVVASIGTLLGVPVSVGDVEGMNRILGAREVAGVSVDEQSMLTLSAVWACARLISETIATLPLSMYERTANGKRIATQHPLHLVIHTQPNAETTAAVHWESCVAAMLLRGNAYCEKLMIGDRVVGLDYLVPNRLTRTRQSSGVLEWRYTKENGQQRTIPDNRIWRLPGFSLDGKTGVSVIRHGAQIFGNALAATKASSQAFQNGSMQPLYYKVLEWLKPLQRTEFKQNVLGSVERGETPLLEGGIDVTSTGLTPIDAQLLESRAYSVEEICRWFRVPPYMVGHTAGSTNWGTGIEQQMIGFLTFTLAPWLRRIEQAIVKDLLTPAERLRYYPKFAVEGLLRADSAGRAAFYAAMTNNGTMTSDEVRELEDLPAMGGNAAVLRVQSAMTTLEAIGKTDPATQARASLRSLLGINEDTKD